MRNPHRIVDVRTLTGDTACMARKLTIHLVRHGQSEANLDKSLGRTVPDHAVALSDAGRAQALAAGAHLRQLYETLSLKGEAREVAAYVSPYRRTRETWSGIREVLSGSRLPTLRDLRPTESIFLRELEFGLFDGYPDEEIAEAFPREYAHYEKTKLMSGEFYARMPSGESRCDVAQRVSQFFGTLHRDAERHGVTDAVVVSHGVTVRAFAMQWLNLPVEWYAEQRNPRNCSVWTLEGDRDLGFTFAGFDHPPKAGAAQDRREDADVGEATDHGTSPPAP